MKKTAMEMIGEAKARVQNLNPDQVTREMEAGALIVDVLGPRVRQGGSAAPASGIRGRRTTSAAGKKSSRTLFQSQVTGEDFLGRLVTAFDRIQIPYMVTGSFASSAHGRVRATEDIDVESATRPGKNGNLQGIRIRGGSPTTERGAGPQMLPSPWSLVSV